MHNNKSKKRRHSNKNKWRFFTRRYNVLTKKENTRVKKIISEWKNANSNNRKSTKEIDEIQELIKKHLDVKIKFDSPRTLGLHGITKTYCKEIATSETKFHRGSVRSGQKVEFEGSLVILGDVNDGAEVIAGENIIVLGDLRGLAHAGAKGNKEAIIAASSIEAPQLRISNIIKEREREEILESTQKTYAYVDAEGKMELE